MKTRLQQLRTDKLVTIEDLAAATGVSERTIRRLEAGTITRPRMSTLGPLAEFLEAKPSSLLGPAVADHQPAEAAA